MSIFSRDQLSIIGNGHSTHQLDAGARAIRGFCRPWVRVTAGVLSHQRASLETKQFVAIINEPLLGVASQIYVPRSWYPDGYQLLVQIKGLEEGIEQLTSRSYTEEDNEQLINVVVIGQQEQSSTQRLLPSSNYYPSSQIYITIVPPLHALSGSKL